MKKQKLKRRGYRTASKKFKKIKKVLWRVLFVIICAAALFVFSVFLGSRLKEMAVKIDGALTPSDTAQTQLPESSDADVGVPGTSDASRLDVTAAYLDVLSTDPDGIGAYLAELNEAYNTVAVDVTADDGTLVYLSEALLEYVRLDPSSVSALPVTGVGETAEDGTDAPYEIDVYENLIALTEYAEDKELRTCAVYTTSPDVIGDGSAGGAVEIDSIIIGELFSMGFDEVLIDGLLPEEDVDMSTVRKIISYLASIREKSGETDIGLLLPESLFLVPQSAGIVKELSVYADYLAMAISPESGAADEVYSVTYENYHSVRGNFSVYNMRCVILETDPMLAAAACTALKDLAGASVQFTAEIDEPVYSAEEPEESTSPVTEDTIYNENANREDYYTNDTESNEETFTEAEPSDSEAGV